MRAKDLRRSSASPEVLSPSAHTGRAALSGFAVLQTIPLRCYACPTRAGADLLTTFTLAVFRCWRMRCESARCGGRAGLSVPVGSVAFYRDGQAACCSSFFPVVFRSSGAGAAGESGQSRSPSIQPLQALPPRILRAPFTSHAPTRLLAWRSATRAGLFARPGRAIRSFPRFARRRSWGSTLRRFAPTGRVV